MSALNRAETENLELSERAMSDAVGRLKRAKSDEHNGFIEMDLAEADFIINSLTKAKSLVNTVKQMKGYYPA